MKIAIAATGPSLDARIEKRLGLAKCLLIVDLETGKYESLEIGLKPGGSGAGIQIALLAMEKGSTAIVAGYVSPQISNTLSKAGVALIPYQECSIQEFMDAYHRGEIDKLKQEESALKIQGGKSPSPFMVIKQTGFQFLNIMPTLLGVVLLIGLTRSLLKEEMLLTLFKGRPVFDTILGAFAGSIFIGTPINSYVIGDTLLNIGVNYFVITALLFTWVTVGLVQLPAEIAALGRSFGLIRIVVAFVVSILMALIMGGTMGIIQ
jgi:predicted Fe-Mo cluster-binding NifX family protein